MADVAQPTPGAKRPRQQKVTTLTRYLNDARIESMSIRGYKPYLIKVARKKTGHVLTDPSACLLDETVQSMIKSVVDSAATICENAGRDTITEKDIKAAVYSIFPEGTAAWLIVHADKSR
jgi:hypothetical protein